MSGQRLKNFKLIAENGKRLPALKVFSEAIRYLKNHFEDLLRNSTLRKNDDQSDCSSSSSGDKIESSDSSIKNVSTSNTDTQAKFSGPNFTEKNEFSWSDDILWVLTVPAIWTDQAKQFMRDAAIQVFIKRILDK